MTYAEKLKDPRWQKRRLEILSGDDFTCQNCRETTKTLHVDHKVYRKGYEPWDYPDDDLQTLCEDCHAKISEMRTALFEIIGQMNTWELEQLFVFIRNSPIADKILIMRDLDASLISIEDFREVIDEIRQGKL